jgi:hypothetical protein
MVEAISLFFSPKFGTIHTDNGLGLTYYVVDEIWANRIKVATPIIEGNFTRTTFQIGRQEDCWIRYGAGTVSIKFPHQKEELKGRPAHDSLGTNVFDVWSRVQCTLAYDQRENGWEWVVMTGGVFIDKSKVPYERVPIIDPKAGVYLNGQRLKPKDQIALFKGNNDSAFLCFGHSGKIFIKRGAVGEDFTALPAQLWSLGQWPTLDQVKLDSLNANQKRFEIEQKTLEELQQKNEPKKGATLGDLGLAILKGPSGIPNTLWQSLLTVIVLFAIWLWRQ